MMYVIVAGINPLSKKFVKKMEGSHDLVVIDEDEDKCERLYSSSSATVINKNPTSIQALEDAGVGKADVVVSTMDEDNENMVVCSLAKKYGVSKVVSKVENDQYLEAFQVIGAEAVDHTDILLSEFLSTVEHPYLVKIANLSGNREVLKAEIREDSSLEGKLGSEIPEMKKYPESFQITALVKDNKVLTGEIKAELRPGDKLLLVGPEKDKKKLDRFFQSR